MSYLLSIFDETNHMNHLGYLLLIIDKSETEWKGVVV